MQIFEVKSENRKVKSVECRGKRRGKYWMVMEWYRSGNEMASRNIHT